MSPAIGGVLRANTVRRRALWPTLAAVALLAAGAAIALRHMSADQMTARLESRGRLVGHMVADVVEADHDADELGRVVSALGAEPQVDLVLVAEGDPAQVIASTRHEYLGLALGAIGDSTVRRLAGQTLIGRREALFQPPGGDGIVCVVPTLHDESSREARSGAVAVVLNGRAVRAEAAGWRTGLVWLLLALLVAALASAELVLRHSVLRPVEAIAAAIERRRAGDRTATAPVYAHDEIGRLATALNEANAAGDAALSELEYQKFAIDQAATVMVTDPAGTILYVNDAYCRMSGYSRDQLLGANPRVVKSGHHPPAFYREMLDCLHSGRVWRGEMLNTARGGTRYWVHSTIIPSLGADGRPDRFTAVLFDITERVRAAEALRASESRTRQIVDSALDGVVTIDHVGNVLYWNRQAERIFGWSAEEVVGRPLVDAIVPPQFRAAHARGMERYLRTGEGSLLGQHVELVGRRRDGSEFPLELSIAAVTLENGVMFNAFVRDISGRKRAEDELVQAKDAAQAASRAKSEFLAMMSHEIRTPMNGVIGFTDLLLETPLDGAQREYAETIRTSGHALLALINDILDFSKIEAGKLDIERAPFDARSVAGEAVELLSAKAEGLGLELVLDWPDDVPHELVGDPMRFRQVLLNLLGNAVKFTPAGGVEVRARREPEGFVRVQVTDTGIGIPAERLAKLFRVFSQADSSTTRRFGGTGLGLAISRQLVDLMGGRIGVESAHGQGSTFWFTIPVSNGSAAGIEPANAGRAAGERPRVLVLNDRPRSLAVLVRSLAPHVAEVTGAAGTGPALELLRTTAAGGQPFQAVVVDLRDSDAGAGAFRDAVAADPSTGAPALVLLVPGARRADAARLRESGFGEVVVKPVVHPGGLAAAIERAIADAHASAAAAPAPSQVPARASAPAGAAPRTADGTPPGEGHRVLLAEDQPINQKLAVRVLTRLGCRVDLAENGIEACALAAASDYSLVIMDCHMPEMDGFEATAVIRAHEAAEIAAGRRRHSTPIVALTASVLKSDRDRCFASGMNDFISKPFRAEQIQAALDRWAKRDEAGGSEGPLREAA